MWNSLDGYKQAADQFNRWAEQTNKRGMRFGFHNHNYEFRKFGDTTGFDTLLARTDPKLVFFEMDCYWIAQAGLDPVKMLKEHGSRIKLLHVKDRKAGFPTSTELNKPAEHFAEVGTGEIDWKAVFATASASGVEHYFVEQDECERPPLESLQISYNNLQKLLA
jgi:sugar phosphate isomerase/epimerase